MPANVLFLIGIYRDAREVSIFSEGNLSWDDNSPWQERILGAGKARAQDELIRQTEHRPTRLALERRDERVASHQVSSKREGLERVEVGRILPASQRGRNGGLNT